MLGDRVVRRQTRMRQHSDGIKARGRQDSRMRAVERGVMLPHGRHPQLLDFRFLQTLRLGTPVLKPDLHLQHNKSLRIYNGRDS